MSVNIVCGDALEKLAELPAGSVNCCVTSPPYYGLRDYGTAQWEGGETACQHSVGGQVQDNKYPGAITTGQRPGVDASHCRKCGARRIDQQLGLEATPDEYVAQMVAVFREVRRVLRDDGTLWLNIGDSYHNYRVHKDGGQPPQGFHNARHGQPENGGRNRGTKFEGIKEKDLIGVPWALAFALRADGWYLRQDIIWSKPNTMPESVTDRCTKAHEYLFLLSKSDRYYYDAEAIKEDVAPSQVGRVRADPIIGGASWVERGQHSAGSTYTQKRKTKVPGGWDTGDGPHGTIHRTGRTEAEYVEIDEIKTRNKRSVWTISTAHFPEAHFATFPPALVEPCILAGCVQGGTVLDPFGGSGTVGLVADRLGRNAILIELNPTYAQMGRRRIENDAPLFAQVVNS